MVKLESYDPTADPRYLKKSQENSRLKINATLHNYGNSLLHIHSIVPVVSGSICILF